MKATPCGLVFDVQRFSVHDGPGIRTTVFFKGCPLRCAWCQNPESLRPDREIAFDAGRCRDAGDCYAACPLGALRREGDRVARDRCDACGRCAAACAYGALRVVGRHVTLEALLDDVLRDRPFYEATGGGVTLSGGEPTFQPEFLGAFAARCRKERLRVGLQTCGAFRWEAFAPYLACFEFIHFDLKVMDPREHRRLAGAGNGAILANAQRLVAVGAPVLFRMPVVPGLTDTDANPGAVAAFLRELDVRSIQLLPYHRLGEAKLARVGFPIPVLRLDSADVLARVARAAAGFESVGIEAVT